MFDGDLSSRQSCDCRIQIRLVLTPSIQPFPIFKKPQRNAPTDDHDVSAGADVATEAFDGFCGL